MTLIEPEDIVVNTPGYIAGTWDYRRRCADVDFALEVTRERVAEWSEADDPHGFWHERPLLIALHNEVLRLREQVASRQGS